MFVEDAPAFFLVGYGATRRVENAETFDSSARNRTRALRYQRVAGLFEDYIGLMPVNVWIGYIMLRGRLEKGITLLNRIFPEDIRVTASSISRKEPQFLMRGTSLPFAALSDGYRGFVGWIGDLLYQLCPVTSPAQKLTDVHGVVMVDELDLLLHPAWQRTVVSTLATTFPNLQFFFTSHSPIIAGTLEAANIFVTEPATESGAITVQPGKESVHGLSADQMGPLGDNLLRLK